MRQVSELRVPPVTKTEGELGDWWPTEYDQVRSKAGMVSASKVGRRRIPELPFLYGQQGQ